MHERIPSQRTSDPGNPYQKSRRSSGAQRWEETRRLFVRAIHRSGDFLDVGCANGLLLETLVMWAREEGFTIRPYGIDLVPELVALARARFPDRKDCFEVANAFYWAPDILETPFLEPLCVQPPVLQNGTISTLSVLRRSPIVAYRVAVCRLLLQVLASAETMRCTLTYHRCGEKMRLISLMVLTLAILAVTVGGGHPSPSIDSTGNKQQ